MLQVVQYFEIHRYTAFVEFAQWCLQNIKAVAFLLDQVFSDESVFQVNGKIINQNVWIWGAQNFYETRKVASDCGKEGFGCAMSAIQAFHPYHVAAHTHWQKL